MSNLAMNRDQISVLWAFARGDLDGAQFEKWLFDNREACEIVGEEFHEQLLFANYSDKDAVWALRNNMKNLLRPKTQCECDSIRNIDAIAMGGDFYFETVFETLDRILEYGPEKWWLYISKCNRCATLWLIAQDERIYDEFLFQRIENATLEEAKIGNWPQQFFTYENVLAVARGLSNPPRFLDPMAGSLQWTVEDLIKERPEISRSEIAHLLGISDQHTSALMRKVQPSRFKLPFWKMWSGNQP